MFPWAAQAGVDLQVMYFMHLRISTLRHKCIRSVYSQHVVKSLDNPVGNQVQQCLLCDNDFGVRQGNEKV